MHSRLVNQPLVSSSPHAGSDSRSHTGRQDPYGANHFPPRWICPRRTYADLFEITHCGNCQTYKDTYSIQILGPQPAFSPKPTPAKANEIENRRREDSHNQVLTMHQSQTRLAYQRDSSFARVVCGLRCVPAAKTRHPSGAAVVPSMFLTGRNLPYPIPAPPAAGRPTPFVGIARQSTRRHHIANHNFRHRAHLQLDWKARIVERSQFEGLPLPRGRQRSLHGFSRDFLGRDKRVRLLLSLERLLGLAFHLLESFRRTSFQLEMHRHIMGQQFNNAWGNMTVLRRLLVLSNLSRIACICRMAWYSDRLGGGDDNGSLGDGNGQQDRCDQDDDDGASCSGPISSAPSMNGGDEADDEDDPGDNFERKTITTRISGGGNGGGPQSPGSIASAGGTSPAHWGHHRQHRQCQTTPKGKVGRHNQRPELPDLRQHLAMGEYAREAAAPRFRI